MYYGDTIGLFAALRRLQDGVTYGGCFCKPLSDLAIVLRPRQ